MIVLGLLLGLVGTDVNSGVSRFTFDIPELADGIGFVGVAMGVFGIAEIIANLEQGSEKREVFTDKVGTLMPTRAEFQEASAPCCAARRLARCSACCRAAARCSPRSPRTRVEKKLSQDPNAFGKGAIEGVAGPESANNAGAQTSFIPMLTLGIPPNAVMALMIGAMMIHGIQPGPQVMTEQPDAVLGPDRHACGSAT